MERAYADDMTSTPGAEHLGSHHRNTLQKLFQHPVSHNIEWHDVVSLLEAVGTVERRHDGKVEVTVGGETGFFDLPAHKDTEIEAVVGLRRLLEAAGYSGDDAESS
ncbi:hypothetical protein EV650_3372 [Kribbella kalugense]|uniref:HicA-like toxin of HicAB toxin-antitoxin system n=2 Tax=Kribbella kalugense TaxID=2512221 RepID=A0A4R8A241_9ACTN|nr:hypothetical protein EV650_3372 [Kribbella kalugense]